MALADEIRARRGDPDDPFDQDRARSDFKRQARGNARRRGEPTRPGGPDPAAPGNQPRRPAMDAARNAGSRVVTSDGAGFVLGVLVYALALNFIRGGPAASVGWLRAKFLNDPYTGPLEGLTPAPGPTVPAPRGVVVPGHGTLS